MADDRDMIKEIFDKQNELISNYISTHGYSTDQFLALYDTDTSTVEASKSDDDKLILISSGTDYDTDQFLALYDQPDSNVQASKWQDRLILQSPVDTYNTDEFLALYDQADSNIAATKTDDKLTLVYTPSSTGIIISDMIYAIITSANEEYGSSAPLVNNPNEVTVSDMVYAVTTSANEKFAI